jgi:hypothetical protein
LIYFSNIIERSLTSTNYSLPSIITSDSSSSTSSIVIPKAICSPLSISFPLNRLTNAVVVTSTSKKIEQQIPVVYKSYNGTETNHYHSNDNTLIPLL